MQYKMQLAVNRGEVNIYLWVLIYVKGPKEKIKDIVVLGRVAYFGFNMETSGTLTPSSIGRGAVRPPPSLVLFAFYSKYLEAPSPENS